MLFHNSNLKVPGIDGNTISRCQWCNTENLKSFWVPNPKLPLDLWRDIAIWSANLQSPNIATTSIHMKGFNAKTRYIHFVRFSWQAARTVASMAFCIEPNFDGDFDWNLSCFDWWNFASWCRPGWRGFFTEKCTCVNLVLIAFCIWALHMCHQQWQTCMHCNTQLKVKGKGI